MDSNSAQTRCPAVVKKLDETVVNRIAAGEVIQRPSNALKELLENCLDANATNIQITVKNGGLKLLQIQDNGTGIRKEDLDIVCERFTTSKLSQFDDLKTIATFGFRGEALASISHVAHLSIVTRTALDHCAYKASYVDSKLVGSIKPCAGNQGTQITAEDLFYNVPTRKKVLKSFNEEHIKVADVISRYSIHNPSVGFTLRKQGDGLAEIRTNPNSTHVDNIRIIYGNSIARSVEFIEAKDDTLKFGLKGYISNVNFSIKKQIFLLFINNRLVDSQALRKSLEQVYSLYLPKGTYAFLYLSLSLDPRNVDVNVHPTKHEVHFLHEDSIIDKVKSVIEAKLLGCNTSRVFYTQTKLPRNVESIGTGSSVSECSQTTAPNQMVRTDYGSQKLDKFFCSSANVNKTNVDESSSAIAKPRREIKLTSVTKMRKEVEENTSSPLKEVLQNFAFVGVATPVWCLIQNKTELYVCNSTKLLEEMFYQIMLFDFGNFGVIKFSDALSIKELVLIALDLPEAEFKGDDDQKIKMAESATQIICSRSAMLNDYFSMEIDKDRNLVAIPLLLDKYVPDVEGLPMYILRLATEVDWENEMSCFKTFCKETAMFYVRQPWKDDFDIPNIEKSSTSKDKETGWNWTLEHILFPAIRRNLSPSKSLFDERAVLQIASLPQLYKVFERC